jgi:UDP-N-acetylmuramoyl-L-alanyl-D-glutamate--2,6-diaminopimelate ligase
MRSILRKLKNRVHLSQYRKAAKKYGHPDRELKLIGVTGTDGKTTTTSLIYHIMLQAGLKVGYVSTTGAKIGKKDLDTGLHVTSPDPWDLPKYLRMMVDEGIEFAVLETTSMGLDQNRFGDIEFDAAVITNIKDDHLDYHGTWDKYAKAKFKLLEKLKEESVAVLNADDTRSAEFLQVNSAKLKQTVYVRWASKNEITNYQPSFTHTKFTYRGIEFNIPIFGAVHNLDNIMQAILLCESILPLNVIKKSLENFKLPSGRLETMINEPIRVIVDFAHTPAALENALSAVKTVLPKGKRLITVFGCAGKRDKGRRRMGSVSAEMSDITILTAEDPRSEKLAQINNDIFNFARRDKAHTIARFANHDDYALTSLGEIHAMLESTWKQEQKPFIMFDEDSKNSRRDAIELAIRLARVGDCVFITGKGHEQSLAFGKQEKEYAWSDQEEVIAALRRLRITQ